jgi:HD superfamily phosphohydrolase
VDFILSRLYPDSEKGVVIDSRGIPNVESVLFSKYLMYRAVYWHSMVRSATGMIKKALMGGLQDDVLKPEDLYGLDDAGLFALLSDRSHPFFHLAEKVQTGRFYTGIAEFPFDEALHRDLLDIGKRSQYEAALAAELSLPGETLGPESIIIDIPESISFETGLFVADEGCYFSESSSVFNPEVVGSMVKSLRIIRIFVDPDHENRVKLHPKFGEILRIRKKWLNLT